MKPKDLAPAENENKTEPETEDREQSNEANKDKNPSNDKRGHGDEGAITKARCGPDSVGVKHKAIIPHPTTRDEAEGEQKTVCDWTPDTKMAVEKQKDNTSHSWVQDIGAGGASGVCQP